jgi:hypothetical protein
MNRFLLHILFFLCILEVKGQLQTCSDYPEIHVISIGISDYKNIRKLKYAHRDAIAFTKFVEANKLWDGKKNISLLINEQATSGNIVATLQSSLNSIDSCDLVLFYFAGHGDTEDSLDSESSFLLAFEAPLNNYRIGDSFSSNALSEYLIKVAEKGAQSIVIIDACRSGAINLTGGKNGTENTYRAFLKRKRSEIRILSTQHNQGSIEKGELGGGRGVFSYYLEKGLKGAADNNKDSLVVISEITNYVTPNVELETQYQQSPTYELNNYSFPLSTYSSIFENENNTLPNDLDKIATNARLLNPDYNGKCKIEFNSFYSDLNSNSCDLDTLFKHYSNLKYCDPQLAVKIQNELIGYLINEIHHIVVGSLNGKTNPQKSLFDKAIQMIDSVQLFLGDKQTSFYYSTLHDTKLMLTALNMTMFSDAVVPQKNDLIEKKHELTNAISQTTNNGHLLYALSAVYSKLGQIDSSIYSLQKSIEKSPTWLNPKYQLIKKYRENGNISMAIEEINRVLTLDTIYKNYACISCFFEEINEIIGYYTNYDKIDAAYAKLLELPLLENERSQILFHKYCFASEKGTFSNIGEYHKLKKRLGMNFSDRMVLLATEVHHQKMFLSDRKIRKTISILDKLIEQHLIEDYLLGKNRDLSTIGLKSNRLLNRLFPEDKVINGYGKEDYDVYRSYILDRLEVW